MFVPVTAINLSLSRFTAILYFVSILPEVKLFTRVDRIEKILVILWSFFFLLTFISIINVNEVSQQFFHMTIFQDIIMFGLLVNHD